MAFLRLLLVLALSLAVAGEEGEACARGLNLIFCNWSELNLMFVIVVLVTVTLEFLMGQLLRRAPEYLRACVAELNKELALLGLVSFIMAAVDTSNLSDRLETKLKIFDWCHLCLFVVAITFIVTQAFLLCLVRCQERLYRRYEAGNREILKAGIRASKRKLHVTFEVARFVFESDRRHFFSKHLFPAPETESGGPLVRRCPSACPATCERKGCSVGTDGQTQGSTLSPLDSEDQQFGPLPDSSTAPAAPPLGQSLSQAKPEDVEMLVAATGEALGPPSPPACVGSVGRSEATSAVAWASSAPPKNAEAQPAPGSSPPVRRISLGGTSVAVAQFPVVGPPRVEDLSFAEYLTRCARNQVLELVRVTWVSWAVLLLILVLHQIIVLVVPNHFSHSRVVYSIVPGACLLLVMLAIWVYTYRSYWHHMNTLIQLAPLHSTLLDRREASSQRKLEALLRDPPAPSLCCLSSRVRPLPIDLEAAGGDVQFGDASLQAHRMALYQRSVHKKKPWYSMPDTPRSMQTILLLLGLYVFLFVYNASTHAKWHDGPGTVFSYLFGVGTPVAIYFFLLPDILYRRTLVVSAGKRIDLQLLRELEREQKAKVTAWQQQRRRRGVLRRMRAKLRLLALLKLDDWDAAVRYLAALPVARYVVPHGLPLNPPAN